MLVSFTECAIDSRAWRFFARERLDVFYSEDVLTALYGSTWTSAFVTDGRFAMLHVFVQRPIGSTGLFDAEAWLGYAGPIIHGEDGAFAHAAMAAYSGGCRERGIVAEVIRFDPLRNNCRLFTEIDDFELFFDRPIVYVRVLSSREDQLRVIDPASRRQIERARHRYATDGACDTYAFQGLYTASLDRLSAPRRWYFSDATFRAFDTIDGATYSAVRRGDEVVSAVLTVARCGVAHTLLVANADPATNAGACDLLMFEAICGAGEAGHRTVCLGGGRTSHPADPLLRFKRKFGGMLRPLPVGFVRHNVAELRTLVERATAEMSVAAAQPACDLVRQLLPYRFVPALADGDNHVRTNAGASVFQHVGP
jgi:hypothetical protein